MTDLLADLVQRLMWPLVVIIVVLLFRRPVTLLFYRVWRIEVDAAGKKVKIDLARRVLGVADESGAHGDSPGGVDGAPDERSEGVARAIETIIKLSSTQAKIVRVLEDRALSRLEIGRRLVSLFGSETRPSQIYRLLGELVDSGLVERIGSDLGEYRLTPDGRALLGTR